MTDSMQLTGKNVIYVTKNNVSNSDNCFSSISKAINLSRKNTEKSKIIIKGGEYFLRETLQLDHRDNNLTIEGVEGEETKLFGGVKVKKWTVEDSGYWSTDLTNIVEEIDNIHMLEVNGCLAERSRLPEKGYFNKINSGKRLNLYEGHCEISAEDYTFINYEPSDLEGIKSMKNGLLTVCHSWDDSFLKVKNVKKETQQIIFTTPSIHSAAVFINERRYILWNLPEGMTNPGQWYIDYSDKKLYYWPKTEDEIDNTSILIPTTDSIIRIQGADDQPVKGLTIKNIGFSVTNSLLTNQKLFEIPASAKEMIGESAGVGGRNSNGAISLEKVDGCKLLNLNFFNIGGQAVKGREVNNLRIVNCEMNDIGAAGINLNQGCNIEIVNNNISNIGKIYLSANALILHDMTNSTIAHNEIQYGPYGGINLHTGQNNLIKRNKVSDVMQELSDGAGIYVGGPNSNNIVMGNIVEDVDKQQKGGSVLLNHAFYFDCRSEGNILEGNISKGCLSALHIHMCLDIVVRNNFFSSPGKLQLSFARSLDTVFENNVIQAEKEIVIYCCEQQNFYHNVMFGKKRQLNCLKRDSKIYNYNPIEINFEPDNIITEQQIEECSEGIYRISSELMEKLNIRPVKLPSAGVQADLRETYMFFENAVGYVEDLYTNLVKSNRASCLM